MAKEGLKRGMFAVGITLALALAGTSAAAQEPARSVTLEEALELALRHSPQVVQAEGSVQTAESAERTAWGAFLPNLNLNTGASLSSTERFNSQTNTTVTGSSDSYSAGVSSSIELFSGGRRLSELRRSRAATSASEASLIEQRFAVILTTKTAFYEVLRAEDLVRSAQARVERAQQGIDAAQQRARVGSATRSDVLRAELELNNARQALLQVQNQRKNATFALGRLVGADGAVGSRETEPLQPRPLSVSRAELADLVLRQAPVVTSATASAAASEAAVRTARAQYLPTISASAGYDWFNQNPSFSDVRDSWSMRLGVSFPVFNRFQREDGVGRAQVQASIAQAQLEDTRRAARADLESVLAALELAEQQITLATDALRVAEEDLRVQEERYRLGVATMLDQLTSQENLVRAEADLIAARYDYQIARARLEALAGREL